MAVSALALNRKAFREKAVLPMFVIERVTDYGTRPDGSQLSLHGLTGVLSLLP